MEGSNIDVVETPTNIQIVIRWLKFFNSMDDEVFEEFKEKAKIYFKVKTFFAIFKADFQWLELRREAMISFGMPCI